MSWGLYNHNYTVNSDASVPATDPDKIITPEYLYTGDLAMNFQHLGRGLFACGSNGKILVNPRGRGGTYFDYSSDGGQNWTRKNHSLVGGGTESITDMIYDEANDAWYVAYYNATSNVMGRYRSTNNGGSWVALDIDSTKTGIWDGIGIFLGSDGALYGSARTQATTQLYISKYNDPLTTTAISGWTAYTKNRDLTAIIELGGKILTLVTSAGSSPSTLWSAGTGLSSSDYETGTWSFSSDIYTSSFSMTDGTRAFYNKSVSGSSITIHDVTASSPPSPYPSQTVVFDEGVIYGDIGYSAEISTWVFLAASTVTNTKIKMQYSATGDSWIGTQTINLTHATVSTYENQVGYIGGSEWIFAYRGVDTLYRLIKFTVTAGNSLSPQDRLLRDEINSQSPDIFYKMDDTGTPSSVVDVGLLEYANTAEGTITFEQASIVDDGGTAALFGSATDTAICIDEAIPASTHDAHLFMARHDGAASIRTLLCSGDYANTADLGGFSFYLELQADHTVRYAAYNGATWEYLASVAVMATDTDLGLILIIENPTDAERGKVSIYNYGDQIAYSDDIATPQTTGSNQRQCIYGKYSGGSLIDCADGVTGDYYSQIPYGNLDLDALVTAVGGTLVAPEPDEPTDTGTETTTGTIFLVHADSTEGPIDSPSKPGTAVLRLPNSAGNSNEIHTEATSGVIDTTNKVFGAGSALSPYRSSFSGVTPITSAYWEEGAILEMGRRRFSYDIRVKADWSNGFCFAGSNQAMYRSGGKWYRYGGITVSVSQQPGIPSQCRISLNIGASLSDALAGRPDQLIMHWNNIPGYVAGGFNHIAICRDTGLSLGGYPQQTWYVFCNGSMGGAPGVIEDVSQAYQYANIHKGGRWYFSSYLYNHYGLNQSLYTPPSQWDEARLVMDEALFTLSFSPPSSPYA